MSTEQLEKAAAIRTAPNMRGIFSIAEFRNWENLVGEGANIARVPLAKRAPLPPNAMTCLLGFDNGEFNYDPFFTLWSQGAWGSTEDRSAANAFNFSYWQYADISYYFGHSLLTIPPVVWTNAAHKNGVLSLGTLSMNWEEQRTNPDWENYSFFTQQDIIDLLTATPSNPNPEKMYLEEGIAKLKKIRDHFGFDGYLINTENLFSLKPSDELRPAFLKLLSSLSEGGKICIIYDCAAFNKPNSYSEWLNAEQYDLFQSAGWFQSDYNWGDSNSPGNSWETISSKESDPGKRLELRKKVFSGIDTAYGRRRGPYQNEYFFDCLKKIKNTGGQPAECFTGFCMYYPAWTMYDFRKDPDNEPFKYLPSREEFHTNDQAFWTGTKDIQHYPKKGIVIVTPDHCMSHYLQERTPITSVPFITWFNDGEGDFYNIVGGKESDGPWNNLSDQSVLPTYRFTFKNGPINKYNQTRIYHDSSENVYSGGSSLLVSNEVAGNSLNLFKTEFSIKKGYKFTLTVKDKSLAANIYILMTLQGRTNPETLYFSGVQELKNGWFRIHYDIPSSYTGNTVVEIQLQIAKNVSFYLGEFAITEPWPDIEPFSETFQGNPEVLDWEKSFVPTSHYRVYGVKNKKYSLISVVYNHVYRASYRKLITDHIFNQSLKDFDNYWVQEVDKYGRSASVPAN